MWKVKTNLLTRPHPHRDDSVHACIFPTIANTPAIYMERVLKKWREEKRGDETKEGEKGRWKYLTEKDVEIKCYGSSGQGEIMSSSKKEK